MQKSPFKLRLLLLFSTTFTTATLAFPQGSDTLVTSSEKSPPESSGSRAGHNATTLSHMGTDASFQLRQLPDPPIPSANFVLSEAFRPVQTETFKTTGAPPGCVEILSKEPPDGCQVAPRLAWNWNLTKEDGDCGLERIRCDRFLTDQMAEATRACGSMVASRPGGDQGQGGRVGHGVEHMLLANTILTTFLNAKLQLAGCTNASDSVVLGGTTGRGSSHPFSHCIDLAIHVFPEPVSALTLDVLGPLPESFWCTPCGSRFASPQLDIQQWTEQWYGRVTGRGENMTARLGACEGKTRRINVVLDSDKDMEATAGGGSGDEQVARPVESEEDSGSRPLSPTTWVWDGWIALMTLVGAGLIGVC